MEIKDNLKILAGIVGVALVYRWLIKPKKQTKKQKDYSSFVGSPFGQRVMFTLTNTTDKVQEVPLFNAYSNIQNQSVGITPSIAEFNRTLLNDPKQIRSIEIKSSGSTTQVQKPIQVYCKDASGEFKGSYLYPMVSVNQVAQDMTTVEPKNLKINGECYLKYKVEPKRTVVLIVHYKEIKKSDKLSSAKKKVLQKK